MKSPANGKERAWRAAALCAVIAYVDGRFPLGVPIPALYVVPLLMAMRLRTRRATVLFLALTSALTFAGLYLSPGGYVPLPIGVLNRAIIVGMLIAVAAPAFFRKKAVSLERQFAKIVER